MKEWVIYSKFESEMRMGRGRGRYESMCLLLLREISTFCHV